jgi:hypothetical protein
MATFASIPQFTRMPSYRVDVDLGYLEEHLQGYIEDGFNMDPDFQRAHVWTEAQQIAFIEYLLRGGKSGLEIYINCPGWGMGERPKGQFVLVDGKQRLHAALRFLHNEISAFGAYLREYIDHGLHRASFHFNVNDLRTTTEVLQWYLDLNSGGTPHTSAELERVRGLLQVEKSKT